MSKKLIIFGGKGFVGGVLAKIAKAQGWEVCIADDCAGLEEEGERVDITDAAAVEQVIAAVKPLAVVNVAAIAAVDRAERDQALAYQVNVAGARNIAEICHRHSVRYVFFSSDAVFDGHASSYSEEDLPNPLNYYGKTKQEAEKEVLRACPSAVVIRISLVLGYPVEQGNSFFANLADSLRSGKDVFAPAYEIRTPVDVITLSECVLELCDRKEISGLLHVGSIDSIDRYQLTSILAQRMGFPKERITPQLIPVEQPGRAPRHFNGIIRVDKAQSILHTRLLTTAESIDRAFRETSQPT